MSDLVERLEELRDHFGSRMSACAATCAEAAAEIQRLRAELETSTARIKRRTLTLQEIEASALRNNGPLASDHDSSALNMIGRCAQLALTK